MRKPVNPNPAVQAGIMQLKRLTTRIMAKQDQKDRPMAPPTEPTLSVATAMFALSLGEKNSQVKGNLNHNTGGGKRPTYQNVQAFQTLVVLFCRSSSVTRWMPRVSTVNKRFLIHDFDSAGTGSAFPWIGSSITSRDCCSAAPAVLSL